MKNRTKEAWIWYWGDENGIISNYKNEILSNTFTDYDTMKQFSTDHSKLFAHAYKGYWSSYIKIEG